MKFLLTGATGFIGKHLLNIISNNDDEVYAVVRSNASAKKLVNFSNVIPVVVDLDNINLLHSILQNANIDCCINLAWQGITGSDRGSYDLQLRNVKRTLDLCEELAILNIRRFVGIGSLAEKDTSYYIPIDGSTPNNVANYGIAKTTAHYMSKVVCNRLGIEHVWCQLSNIYGIGDTSNNFINFACKLMLDKQHAAFTAGTQMYDFVYVSDAAKGIYLASKEGNNNTNYYVGSGHQRRLKEYIYELHQFIDPNLELFLGEVPFNGICLPDEEFDSSKLEKDTGYQSEVDFNEGISLTVNWLKNEMKKPQKNNS